MSEKSINKWKKKIILTYHLTTSIIFFFSYKLCCKLGNLTIVNKYDFWITTYVHVLYYIFHKINNYMYSRFNISTGAFISFKTTSQVAEASYHIRICVCNIWFTDQCHSYKKFTLNPVQFQSSFFLCINASVEQDLLVMTDSPVSKDQLTTNEHLKVFFTRPICSV